MSEENVVCFDAREYGRSYVQALNEIKSLKQQLKDTNNCLNLQISNVTLLEKELKDKDEKINKLIDYQSAFNELFNFYENDLKDMYSKNDVMVLGRLKYLKQKYNLGGE